MRSGGRTLTRPCSSEGQYAKLSFTQLIQSPRQARDPERTRKLVTGDFLLTDPELSPDEPRRQLLSLILPAYNEQAVLPFTYQRLVAMAPILADIGVDVELILVNDGSRDNTPAILDSLSGKDRRVRAVHLTRNFGHQASVTAGLAISRGDVVMIMDCDLQDPPELIPLFLAKSREGFEVVYATRRARKEWFGKRMVYWAFYRLLAGISELDIPLDSGDFCLLDRSAVDLLQQLPERQRFVRGLRTWVGLRQTGIEYERQARVAGTPAYTFPALVKLAVDGLVSFSNAPLRMVTRLGLFGALAAIAFAGWVLYSVASGKPVPRGWASLLCLVLLMSSVQLISIGIIGEYLSRIFLEVKGRPTYLIGRISEGGRSVAVPGARIAVGAAGTPLRPDAERGPRERVE